MIDPLKRAQQNIMINVLTLISILAVARQRRTLINWTGEFELIKKIDFVSWQLQIPISVVACTYQDRSQQSRLVFVETSTKTSKKAVRATRHSKMRDLLICDWQFFSQTFLFMHFQSFWDKRLGFSLSPRKNQTAWLAALTFRAFS